MVFKQISQEVHELRSTFYQWFLCPWLIKRCAEFIFSAQVQPFQWTDNSAARQRAASQGVGRTRHLLAKIVWIGQVPTSLNLSDVGTKVQEQTLCFAVRSWCHQSKDFGDCGPVEDVAMMEQVHNRDTVAKVVTFIKRLSFVVGMQGSSLTCGNEFGSLAAVRFSSHLRQ